MQSTTIRRRSRRRRSGFISPPVPANNGNGGVQSLSEDDDEGDDRPGLGKGRGKGKGDPDKFPPEPISTSEAIPPSSSLIQPPPTTSDLPTSSTSLEIPESTSPSSISAPAPQTSSHIETQPAYSTTSSIPPIQALNNEHSLRPGQIAGIVVGLLAFVLLTIVSVLFVLRSRRRRAKKYSGQKGLLDSTPATPQPTPYTKHETAEPPTVEDPQLFNTTANSTTEKVIPPTTRLSQWLNQLRHSHIPGTGTGTGTSRKSLPHITIGATSSTPSDTDDSSSILSIPTTFVTRQGRGSNTNSTFLPTTPLHHPRYVTPPAPQPPPPPPPSQRQGAEKQNLQPPPSPLRSSGQSNRMTIFDKRWPAREGRILPPPPLTPTSPWEFFYSLLPSLPTATRLSVAGVCCFPSFFL
ncbi:predicted protein [Chaetomium globosum CBS 148.51]|uniref:Uncharacterized protein n=1 Tax=Chaetomium globosum (strain ATCC 6205 / CBS 148.51 / DSM 1962 / NBRC 6347 / NRRL 1970) TaxID=306901 RepID=Q2GZR2_CHAGB|nr:uncharacterized protein CHGG_04984 [Chaetomium globosum CBS 148.51]EAQ88365.1 predicted protein [Chaetomium globosum CBS 148.51]